MRAWQPTYREDEENEPPFLNKLRLRIRVSTSREWDASAIQDALDGLTKHIVPGASHVDFFARELCEAEKVRILATFDLSQLRFTRLVGKPWEPDVWLTPEGTRVRWRGYHNGPRRRLYSTTINAAGYYVASEEIDVAPGVTECRSRRSKRKRDLIEWARAV